MFFPYPSATVLEIHWIKKTKILDTEQIYFKKYIYHKSNVLGD